VAILFDYTCIYDAYNSIEDLVFFTESQMSGNEYHYFTTTCTTWFELLLSFMDVCFLGRLISSAWSCKCFVLTLRPSTIWPHLSWWNIFRSNLGLRR